MIERSSVNNSHVAENDIAKNYNFFQATVLFFSY
jgi:hypothetical protein